MDIFLTEKTADSTDKNDLKAAVEDLANVITSAGGEPVEFFFGEGLKTIYSISEAPSKVALEAALIKAELTYKEVAAVRIVGATIEEVRSRSQEANYLVEWDLPADLSMETYLARKKEKSPLYENVPETTFMRTYVREDMQKCVCLYDAPDDEAVIRARDVVDTPIDRMTTIGSIVDD
ncbi:MAG: DUF4242 domain-containing protein [Dehalococcoidia bacterium]|nr:DUF4242 domain-containing protein [Dehalococcoidia bacterium]